MAALAKRGAHIDKHLTKEIKRWAATIRVLEERLERSASGLEEGRDSEVDDTNHRAMHAGKRYQAAASASSSAAASWKRITDAVRASTGSIDGLVSGHGLRPALGQGTDPLSNLLSPRLLRASIGPLVEALENLANDLRAFAVRQLQCRSHGLATAVHHHQSS